MSQGPAAECLEGLMAYRIEPAMYTLVNVEKDVYQVLGKRLEGRSSSVIVVS